MRRPPAADWAVLALCLGVSGALLLNLCHLLFRCGCRAWWSGAAAHCNVHVPGVRHCPWCAMGAVPFAAVFAGIAAAQSAAVLLPPHWPRRARLAAGLAAFPAAGAILGALTGVFLGYWR